MNTPAHLLLGAACFGRGGQNRVLAAAFVGSMAPDASLYMMGSVALFVLQIPPERVFNELYFSDAWQTVFAIDNSFFVWGALLALALMLRSAWAIAFAASALLHIAVDFPLHHDDGRPHFWPVSDWVFESPFSYWDRNHGSLWIAPAEFVVAAVALVVLLRARVTIWALCLATVLFVAEAWVVFQWLWVFAT